VIIGIDLKTVFHKREIYVLLGPPGCMDACSSIYASRKEFERAVRWNKGQYY